MFYLILIHKKKSQGGRQASLRAGQAGLEAGGNPKRPAFGQPRLGARPGWCPRGPAFWPAQAGCQAGLLPEPAGLTAGQAGVQAGAR